MSSVGVGPQPEEDQYNPAQARHSTTELKVHHHDVMDALIALTTSNRSGGVTLDLGSGRGGAMSSILYDNKVNPRVSRAAAVLSVENMKEAITTAMVIYQTNTMANLKRYRLKPPKALWLQHNLKKDLNERLSESAIDLAELRFTLAVAKNILTHFMRSQEEATNFFKSVSRVLCVGGVFLGMTLDGTSILKEKESSKTNNMEWLKTLAGLDIEAIGGTNLTKQEETYGKRVQVTLATGDSTTTVAQIKEDLVFDSLVFKLAKACGFEVIPLESLLRRTDANQPSLPRMQVGNGKYLLSQARGETRKALFPISGDYGHSTERDVQHHASTFYSAFAFRKVQECF